MMDRPRPTYSNTGVRPILLAEDPRNRLFRVIPWTVACVTTLVIHGGLYLYLTHERAQNDMPPVEEAAAVMIDMAPEVQQAFNQNDEAVGKPMVETAEPPPPPDETKPDPTPPVEDSPTEAVAPLPPKPPEKPKEKPPEKKQPPKPKKPIVRPAKAQATTGGPKSDQHAVTTTAASAGASNAAAVADWKSELSAALNRSKRPQSEMGSVVLRIAIAASGAVSSATVTGSSGSSALDAAATETVYRASIPAPPAGAMTITFRMNFKGR